MNKVQWGIVILCLCLWPLGLFLRLPFAEFTRYFTAAVIVGISYFSPYILIFLPLLDVKLLLVPLIIMAASLLRRRSLNSIVVCLLLLLITVKSFSGFYHQSIVPSLSNAKAQVAARIYLYPNPLLARLFQNKLIPYSTAIQSNFFALTDPNNYFFGFHPREIIRDNLNLPKFPFISIIFFIYGLINIRKIKKLVPLALLTFALLVSLSLTFNFDRIDLVILPVVLYVIAHGVIQLNKDHQKAFLLTGLIFFLYTIPDYLHLIINSLHR